MTSALAPISSAQREARRIIKRRITSVKKSSGTLRRISSCISVNGTTCTRSRPTHGISSRASESTLSFAASDVYGGEKK